MNDPALPILCGNGEAQVQKSSNPQEIEVNIQNLLKTTRRCRDSFEKKFRLAEEVLVGVRRWRCDGNDEQLAIQPVLTLNGFVGDKFL